MVTSASENKRDRREVECEFGLGGRLHAYAICDWRVGSEIFIRCGVRIGLASINREVVRDRGGFLDDWFIQSQRLSSEQE